MAPTFWQGPEEEHRRQLADASNAALAGQTNNQFTVILEANATETEVIFDSCRPDISVNLTAASASSTTAVGVWVEPKIGKAIIHHDSSTATDRKFFVTFIG